MNCPPASYSSTLPLLQFLSAYPPDCSHATFFVLGAFAHLFLFTATQHPTQPFLLHLLVPLEKPHVPAPPSSAPQPSFLLVSYPLPNLLGRALPVVRLHSSEWFTLAHVCQYLVKLPCSHVAFSRCFVHVHILDTVSRYHYSTTRVSMHYRQLLPPPPPSPLPSIETN